MLENLRSLSCSAKNYLKVSNTGDDTKRVTYLVSIKTGDMKFAGTDANVYFRITGVGGGETSRIKLDNTFRDDFERGATDKFKVKLEDIGTPTLIQLEVDHTGLFADWFASMVTVQKSGESKIYEFPVFSWIEGLHVACHGEACLPQDEHNPVIIRFRKTQLAKRRHIYKWRNKENANASGMPGFIAASSHADLPRDIQFTDGLYKDFEESNGVAFMHILQDKVHGLAGDSKEKWESLEEMSRVLGNSRIPKAKNFKVEWPKDEEFGRQMMNGCSPNLLRQCKDLPTNLKVTEDMIKECLDPGRTLQKEIAAGKLFIADCSIAQGIKQKKECVPICLLYQNQKGDLKPIAVQLQQDGVQSLIVTPADGEYDWILAKMYFRCAESNIQQIVVRMLHTHFVLEPFAIAMMRCLSSRHPIFKLLYPHLQYVCAATTIARSSLLSKKGIFDKLLTYETGGCNQLLKKAYTTFNIKDIDVVAKFKTNGTELLSNYHYRDDATALFQCIAKYVSSMIGLYYTSDMSVCNDMELQQFIHETHTEGFAWQDGNSHGCPKSFTRPHELVDLFTLIIFTSTCQHSAVNSGQFEIFMHPLTAPFSLSKSPPTSKGSASLQTVISSLPEKRKCLAQIDLVHAFSKKYEDQAYLGSFPGTNLRLFVEPMVQQVMNDFQKSLKEISGKINERNKKLTSGYDSLLPQNVPTGVTV